MPIEFCLDRQSFSSKPTNAGTISLRIPSEEIAVMPEGLKDVIDKIGARGHTFTPATFEGNERKTENFIQQQFFVLDFDNNEEELKKINLMPINLNEAIDRANSYALPVLFSYDTLSSTTDHPRFRLVFLNDAPVTDPIVARDMNRSLRLIFPESDSCSTDISHFYYGGKKVTYRSDDPTSSTITVERVLSAVPSYLRDTKGPKKYREKERDYWNEGEQGKPSVKSFDVSEYPAGGLVFEGEKGGNLPTPTILKSNIAHGRIPPSIYEITYPNKKSTSTNSLTSQPSTTPTTTLPSQPPSPDTPERPNYHKTYRSDTLDRMDKECQMYKLFIDGIEVLDHTELWGLATNIRLVEGGVTRFIETCKKYPSLHSHPHPDKYWKGQINDIPDDYHPMSCNRFCRFHEECDHKKNVLSTVSHKRNLMEKISGEEPNYISLKACQDKTYKAIEAACKAADNRLYIINSMTSIGKTTCYRRIMKRGGRYLVAVPTNHLKHEVFEDVKREGIRVMMTPSLDEIREEIPLKIWRNIDKLRRNGKHDEVSAYISNVLKTRKIRCLRKYLDEKIKLQKFDGCVIATHRYLLVADHDVLQKYDSIIIDEDILYKAIVTNHVEVSVKKLADLAAQSSNELLRKKIAALLKRLGDGYSQYVKLDGFDWEGGAGSYGFDVKAFCHAEHFYIRCAADDRDVQKDTIVFLDLPVFHEDLKYVMVSATVDEDICRSFFGDERVKFTMCRRARYTGTLKQYHGLSMSRTSLDEHPDIIEFLKEKLSIREVLTYKDYDEDAELYFGNLEGSNMLEGQDLIVLGSAYQTTFVYILTAAALGFDIPADTSMSEQPVEHNGYRFNFMTFTDPDLRAVQFWMIESELEQAVGRARLLRHDCTVYYFGNFPLQQAEMFDGYTLYGDLVRVKKTKAKAR